MEKEKAMYSTKRHRMITQAFVISKTEQVHHFQIRLPRNTKQVVAIDYDVFFNTKVASGGTVIPREVAVTVPLEPRLREASVAVPSELSTTNAIDFNWTSSMNPTIGHLKLQSLETANIFYSAWLKALEWNIGIFANGIFPFQPYTLLNKQKPKKVEVAPQTTILNGLYEDIILKTTKGDWSYTVKVFVWIETNEDANGIDYEFLNQESQNND